MFNMILKKKLKKFYRWKLLFVFYLWVGKCDVNCFWNVFNGLFCLWVIYVNLIWSCDSIWFNNVCSYMRCVNCFYIILV